MPSKAPAEDNAADEGEDGDAMDKDGGAPLTQEEIEEGDIREMAKDKVKSRLLQRTLLRGCPEVSRLVFDKTEPYFMELIRDQYGNYLSQKLLEVASPEQFECLFAKLETELLSLAQDVHGTRAVQKVVEQAVARSKVAELLEALPTDSAEELARSVTGFHVVAKLIELLPAAEVEPFIERLCGTSERCLSCSMDQWGCCVLKRCIDRSEGDLRQKIVTFIADNALQLVQDPFGNYVVQHLILGGGVRPNPLVTRVIAAVKGRIFELSMQKYSSNVLEKCLVHSSDKDRNKIINEILNPPDVLPSEAVKMLLFHQYGNYVFQQALEGAKDPQFSLLIEHSRQLIQDVVCEVEPRTPQPGHLAPEHGRRLALKLIKRYPALSEGFDAGDNAAAAAAVANCWGNYGFDPYAQNYGFDGYGWGEAMPGAYGGCPGFAGWDMPGACGAYPSPLYHQSMGAGGAKSVRGGGHWRRRSQSRKGQKSGDRSNLAGGGRERAAGAIADGCGAEAADIQMRRVGRIVGFWPNYTVTYDDVPVVGPVGFGRGGRSSRSKGNKAKSKASAAKAKAQP